MHMLTVSNLRKDFSTIRAVDDVSFEVRSGEIFGLIGRNGAGKTTTIRCVLNIYEADLGQITFDGKSFSEETRNSVGYLPEERGLYKKSTVLDTICYLAQLRAMSASKAKSEAAGWLKRFELLPWANKKIEELSKGNQQKVQFIASIIHDPRLVVLDEPFSGLDPVNQLLFKDVFLELKQRDKAIIYSTHQMDQAEKLSDDVCLINHGRVVLSGSVRDVKQRYGTNSIHLEYEGDGSFLRSLQGIKSADVFQNSAEIQLDEGFDHQRILPNIIAQLNVRRFELREPSLQSIFLQTVGDATTEAAV